MLPPIVVEILRNLDKNELKKLGVFIQSPYFNTRESLHLLYKEISKQYPEFKPEKFDYKRIYKKIYGADKFKEQTIRNLYSEFAILLKKFVAYERLEAVEPDFNRALINGLRDKKLYGLSSKTISKLKKEPIKSFESEDDYYYEMYYLNHIFHININSSSNFDISLSHETKNNIRDNLSVFYLSTMFFFSTEDSLLTNVYGLKKTPSIHTAILKVFEEADFFRSENDAFNPAFLKIQYLIYKYSENEITEKNYLELEKMVTDHIDEFTVHFKIMTWSLLLTLIVWKLIRLDVKHYRDAFRLNDYFSNLHLFPNDTNIVLSASLFRNAFDTALILKEYEWAENFINKYSPFLAAEIRENIVNYHMGQLNFKLSKYEDSISCFNKLTYDSVREKLSVKFYFLMNYIELKAYQSAISMVSSIKQFSLESKEVTETFAVLVEPSLKFFREIIRAEENNKKLDYSVLKEAQSTGRFYHKQYILEKMEGLVK